MINFTPRTRYFVSLKERSWWPNGPEWLFDLGDDLETAKEEAERIFMELGFSFAVLFDRHTQKRIAEFEYGSWIDLN